MSVGVRRKKGERGAIDRRWRRILDSYTWGTPLSPDDEAFIREQFKNHPNYEARVARGIKYFYVDGDGRKDCCVRIKYLDDGDDPLSKKSCLDKENPFQKFSEACRAAVVSDVLAVKNAAFGLGAYKAHGQPFNALDVWAMEAVRTIVCPLSGVKFTYDQAHVHHKKPWEFKTIVEAFLDSRPDIDRSCLQAYICRANTKGTKVELASAEHIRAFYAFHKERADMVVVAKARHTCKGVKPPPNPTTEGTTDVSQTQGP
jgi:hypothetical protein